MTDQQKDMGNVFKLNRQFRINFEKMIATGVFNRIFIRTAGEFRTIDVLEGHSQALISLDVSLITKSIASYSKD